MGGKNSKETQEQKEENKKEENNQQKIIKEEEKQIEKKDDDINEEEEEEEEEEDDDEEDNNENKIQNKKQNQKKENKYFSIEESYTSKSKVDKQSSYKDINTIKNISELSSYIDERKFNSNTSLRFTIQSNDSKNENNNNNNKNIIISEESFDPNSPKVDNKHHQRVDNKYFGDFNYLDKDLEYKKKTKEESVDSEIEEDKTLPLKERVYNECSRHKYYLDTNEKGAFSKINKKSFSNMKRYKYRKSVLLHKKEITCLISLSGTIKKIVYASSSLDKTISLWDSYFSNIANIKCNEWYSNFICEFDTSNILSCESNHIKMYDLMSENYDCVRIFKDHIEDINCLLPVIDIEEERFIFLSGGKDKTLRLWDHEMDAPIKYYEGHYSTVTQIQKYGNDNKKFISCSDDKTFIVWDIKNTNPLKIFNNYFNHLFILGDNCGFCCGAYDNKIRFYNEGYILTKCIVSKLFGIRYILMINDYCMLIVDIDNNMNILDLDETENNLACVYIGYEGEVVNVIKSFNWDSEKSGSKIIMVASKNGYVYQYSFEYEIKNNNKSNKSKKKKHKTIRKNK